MVSQHFHEATLKVRTEAQLARMDGVVVRHENAVDYEPEVWVAAEENVEVIRVGRPRP